MTAKKTAAKKTASKKTAAKKTASKPAAEPAEDQVSQPDPYYGVSGKFDQDRGD